MNFTELKKDLKGLCKAYNLGTLKGYKTEKNTPINSFDTAIFTTNESSQEYKYHFKN
jgi:hypothetical protein